MKIGSTYYVQLLQAKELLEEAEQRLRVFKLSPQNSKTNTDLANHISEFRKESAG